MLLPKNSKKPLNSLPFFCDLEDPYPFQTYMFQVFRNLAVANASQVENFSKEVLSWVLQEWWIVIDKAITEHEQGKDMCTIVVSKELLDFTTQMFAEFKGTKRRKVDLVPETVDLSNELKKNGLTPKSVIPKEDLNALKETEIFNTEVPLKERRKKPML